jgi:hypothetical protein
MPNEDFPENFATESNFARESNFTRESNAVEGETMFTMSQGLPADFGLGPRRGNERNIKAPASDFWHDGKLNMGPAVWATVALSVLGWAGVIGAFYLVRPLF